MCGFGNARNGEGMEDGGLGTGIEVGEMELEGQGGER